MNAIYILWLRQLKRYVRSKSRLIGSLAQPLLFLLAFGFGFGPIFQKAGQGNYLNFLAPGIVGMTIIFTSVFSGIEIIWDRQFGFLKETLVAPVSRLSVMLGRTLGSATIATIQGLIVFAISTVAGFRPSSWGLVVPAVLVMFVISLVFTAFGTTIGSLLTDMQGFQLIVNFLIMPMFFLSGSLFPLSGLPGVVTVIAAFDPLTYGVDALRGLLIASSHFGLRVDIPVLIGIALLFIGIGGAAFDRIEV